MSDVGYWYCGLDPYEDDEGGQFFFAIDCDDDMSRADPRDLLIHLIEVAQYVLDHDMLNDAEIDE